MAMDELCGGRFDCSVRVFVLDLLFSLQDQVKRLQLRPKPK